MGTESLSVQMAVTALGNANKELSSLKPSGGKFHKAKPFICIKIFISLFYDHNFLNLTVTVTKFD